MSGGGKTQTSTSSVQIPPEVLARYNAVNARAENVASTPFQAYSYDPNAFVAPMTETQNAAIGQIGQASGMAQPYFQTGAAATLGGMGSANLGELDTNKYMSPYLQNVVQSTADILGQQNRQDMSGALGTAIQSGAGFGDRSGIAAANLNRQQMMGMGSTIGNLLNQGYTQAQGVAQQQQSADLASRQANLARLLQGGQSIGQLGAGAQGAALAGSQALLGAGTQEQQTEQAGKSALYNQYQQERAYPFQTTQFLGNIGMGTGALSGSTTTETKPAGFFSGLKRGGKVVEGVSYRRGGLVPESMGGHVNAGHMGEGYADGGAPQMNYASMVMQQLFGGMDPNAGAYGQGNTGIGMSGFVPPANLPVGQLNPAKISQSAPQTSISDLVDTGGKIYEGAKEAGKWWDENKPKSPSVDPDVFEDLDENPTNLHARGGAIRPGLAAGGMPYDPQNTGYVPNNAPTETPELLQPKSSGEAQSGLSKVADIAKIIGSFMANGGVAGRRGYANTGAVGEDPKEVLRKKLTEGDTGLSPEDAAGIGQIFAPPEEGEIGVAPTGTRGVVVTPAGSPETAQPGLVPPTPRNREDRPNIAPTERRALVPTAAGTAELGPTIEKYNPEDFFGSNIVPRESAGRHFDKYGNPLTSSAGAIGISQMLPSTGPEAAALAGVRWDENLFYNSPEYNEKLGRAYFNNLVNRYNGDTTLASAAYNAGMGNVDKAVARASTNGGSWTDYLPGETRKYISGMSSGMPEGIASAVSNAGSGSGGAGKSTEGGLLPADWQAGIDKFNQWGKDNESFIVPLLSGLGGMLSSASPTLAGSIGSGLVAGSNSFSDILNAQQSRQLQSAEANAQMATLVRPDPNNPGFYLVYNPKTGQNVLMSMGQLRAAGLTPPPSGGLVPPAPAAGTPPDGGLVPPAVVPAEVPAGAPATDAPTVPAVPEITTPPTPPTVQEERPLPPGVTPLPANYNFKPVIIDGEYVPSASVSLSPSSRALATDPSNMGDHANNREIYDDLSKNMDQFRSAKTDIVELTEAIGSIAGAGGIAAAGSAAPDRAAVIKFANTFNRVFGLDISADLARAETANDVINKIAAYAGSRMASASNQTTARIAEGLSNALPTMLTNPEAGRIMLAKMLIDAQLPFDKFNYYNEWSHETNGDLSAAEKGFGDDMNSVYGYDRNSLQRAIIPIDVSIGDGQVVKMTPIEGLRKGYISDSQFDEYFPGLIRYFGGQ
jgi:hypothetical protein